MTASGAGVASSVGLRQRSIEIKLQRMFSSVQLFADLFRGSIT
jgi:hypothetical protein